MRRLAILGGTFNPVHVGHLIMAEAALSQCHLDGVLWMPSRYAHYKAEVPLLDLHHRVEMIQRAIAPNPSFCVTPLDQPETGRSYALTLFQQLQGRYPQIQWYWIIGLDAFRTLPRWYGRETLIRQCCWLVAPRLELNTIQIGDLVNSVLPAATPLPDWLAVQTERGIEAVRKELGDQGLSLKWRSLQMPLFPISSRIIRTYCRSQQSIRYLVPDEVYQYIHMHRLYTLPEDFPLS